MRLLDLLNRYAEAGDVVHARAIFERLRSHVPRSRETMLWNTLHPALPIVYLSDKIERERSVTEVGGEGGEEKSQADKKVTPCAFLPWVDRVGGQPQPVVRKIFIKQLGSLRSF